MGTRLFSWSAFPLVLGGSVAWAMLQMQAGAAPFRAFALPLVVANLLVAACERVLPLHRSWLHSRGDLHVDAGLALSVALVSGLLGRIMAPLGVAAAASHASVLGASAWPSGWPLLAQLVLALVVAELPKYWLHRLEHEWAPLWRIHATHHSAQRLYWLNAGRFHPIDIGLDYLLGVGTLLLLGCGDAVIALFILVSGVHGVFQHANLPLRCGPLNWFFSMAELHRWHHMPDAARSNHNYGQNLIVWDVVFGTRFLPAREQPGDAVGIEGWPGFPTGFFANLLVPFRWARVRREAGSSPA
jgi:sterol desaturase/sphingolipid hydroxylase (fatty acid hydroxylase superfamily)